jgi:hypothetical protein
MIIANKGMHQRVNRGPGDNYNPSPKATIFIVVYFRISPSFTSPDIVFSIGMGDLFVLAAIIAMKSAPVISVASFYPGFTRDEPGRLPANLKIY